tara:strand:- start:1317 stop:2306 length:990 start_codon:yes stop_codon:yes gene_type:complete
MALSSDELIKRELIDSIGVKYFGLKARVFPEGSNQDQISFEDGGLTFSYRKTNYGSCDLAYVYSQSEKPYMAIEGTDALNRGSSGNAQYQRFHHALGAVKNGLIGVYYLRKGNLEIREDLYAMAYFSSIKEKGFYIITQSIDEIKEILKYSDETTDVRELFLKDLLNKKYEIFLDKFEKKYKSSWKLFAEKRSTLIFEKHIIKYSARNILNFTDGSQRAGHIAVGEMYLTKYFFPDYKFFYFWPRMNKEELNYLNSNKTNDKEWNLLSTEENVEIITIDDIDNVPKDIRLGFYSIKKEPLKGEPLKKYKELINNLRVLLENEVCLIKPS